MRLTREERRQVALASKLSADAFGIFRPLMFLPNRGAIKIATARQCAMYLANVVAQIPLTHVAQAFGRDISTTSHNIGRIEDLREYPDFDRLMEALERVYRGEASLPVSWPNKIPDIDFTALEPV